MVLPYMVVDMKFPQCTVISRVVHQCKVVFPIIHPCMVVFLVVHPCTMIKHMDLLYTKIDLMVSPCSAIGMMDLPYTVFEGVVLLESWGLRIDREKFLAEECPSDWVDPIKD
jgi:hypothetical protein